MYIYKYIYNYPQQNTGRASRASLLVPSVYCCRKAESSIAHWVQTEDQVCSKLSRVHSSTGSMCPGVLGRARGKLQGGGWRVVPLPSQPALCYPEARLLPLSGTFFQRWNEALLTFLR